jgi:Ras-related protein Rab-7L1
MTEVLFKVLIIGDPTVGKTSFVQRYVNNLYRRDYKMTIGGKDFIISFVFYSKSWDILYQDKWEYPLGKWFYVGIKLTANS